MGRLFGLLAHTWLTVRPDRHAPGAEHMYNTIRAMVHTGRTAPLSTRSIMNEAPGISYRDAGVDIDTGVAIGDSGGFIHDAARGEGRRAARMDHRAYGIVHVLSAGSVPVRPDSQPSVCEQTKQPPHGRPCTPFPCLSRGTRAIS